MNKTKERKSSKASRIASARYFNKINSGQWVDDGCDKCGRGMSLRIYNFQKTHRGETICSTCDKKQRKKDLKEL